MDVDNKLVAEVDDARDSQQANTENYGKILYGVIMGFLGFTMCACRHSNAALQLSQRRLKLNVPCWAFFMLNTCPLTL